ncbi:hypothetical protein [Roseofilum casamattae]|uniref:Uncharacterized protein n=1 Tax=Roseofilum casamattae BLCC-M143 TaxID=3022442 RepID=A0ABT7C361_9CYAN|nr:hypothetical protein [Roseofilum casamattae]MDJ1185860.1 hypothetical protein [Roseofilum casamattae BLCC-M143]
MSTQDKNISPLFLAIEDGDLDAGINVDYSGESLSIQRSTPIADKIGYWHQHG